MKDITTVCPWCKMGLEPEVLEKLVAKSRKEKKVPRKLPTYGRCSLSRKEEEEKAFRKRWNAFLKRWPVHEDWARDKGSQK
jgi:hypothetical protein